MSNTWVNRNALVGALLALGTLTLATSARSEVILSSVEFASLSGYVYCDIDNSGFRDSSEHGISDVKILLEGIEDGGESVTLTILTDAKGWYRFEDLAPGEYSLTEIQPEKYVQSKPNAVGTTGGVAEGSDSFKEIVLAAGDYGVNYNFGEWGLKAKYISKRSVLATPEPSSLAVLFAGLLCVAGLRRFSGGRP